VIWLLIVSVAYASLSLSLFLYIYIYITKNMYTVDICNWQLGS